MIPLPVESYICNSTAQERPPRVPRRARNAASGVDGELLLDVDSDGACADLGVKTVHRKMLLREIDKLRADTFDCTQ